MLNFMYEVSYLKYSIELISRDLNDRVTLKHTYTSMMYWIASEPLLLAMAEPCVYFYLR